jgi:anion-transporting  ArsA/GET3 family ATPase
VSGVALLDRRLVFVLGKGGVGKSVVSAAIATAWAERGERALLIEVQGQNRAADLAGDGEGEATPPSDRPVEVAPDLFSVTIDVERETERYLASQLKVRALVDLLVRTTAFHNFATAAPGLTEMVTLGTIWELAIELRDGAPVWDRLVVDCPATGHGIALLEIASDAGEIAQEGPIHEQARRIHEVVTHPAATGVAVVARPEELPVTEALEAVERLRAGGFPVAAAVLNGVGPERFAPADLAPLAGAAAGDGPVAAACRAALTAARRRAAEDVQRRRFADGTGLVPVDLPLVGDGSPGPEDLRTLAAELAAAHPAPVA